VQRLGAANDAARDIDTGSSLAAMAAERNDHCPFWSSSRRFARPDHSGPAATTRAPL